MFSINCPHCRQELLVGTRSILSLQQTDSGPVATVRCPRGHVVVHDFRTGTTQLPTSAAA